MRPGAFMLALAFAACSVSSVTFRPEIDPSGSDCPPGTSPCGEQCFAVCATGQRRDPDSCLCGCPAGTQLCSGRCALTCSTAAILVDDFAGALDPAKWATSFTPGAAGVHVDASTGYLILDTVPNAGCAAAEAHGLAQTEIASGVTVIFETALEAYHDGGIYGDHQPRGLRSGTDPNNALEFVSAYPLPTNVICRSVQNGMATETTADIGSDIYVMNTYRIEATSDAASFFVNGRLVCAHTTNIPVDLLLNPFYSTSDECLGNVPVVIDRVEFEAR